MSSSIGSISKHRLVFENIVGLIKGEEINKYST